MLDSDGADYTPEFNPTALFKPRRLLDLVRESILETGRVTHTSRRVTEAFPIAWAKIFVPGTEWALELVGVDIPTKRLKALIDSVSERIGGEEHKKPKGGGGGRIERDTPSTDAPADAPGSGDGDQELIDTQARDVPITALSDSYPFKPVPKAHVVNPAGPPVAAVVRLSFEGRRSSGFKVSGQPWWHTTSEEAAREVEEGGMKNRFLDAIRRSVADPRKPMGEQVSLADLEAAERIMEMPHA
jgi:hypothetical protein